MGFSPDPSMWVALGLAARVALGVVFLLAGTSKLRFRGFQQVVEAAGVPKSFAAPVARLLPRFEIGLGVLLLFGVGLPVTSWAVVGLLASFTAMIVANLVRGVSFDCGCFGSLSAPIGWTTVARNLSLVGFAVVSAVATPTRAVWIVPRAADAGFVLPGHDAVAVVLTAVLATVAVFIVEASVRARTAMVSYTRARGG